MAAYVNDNVNSPKPLLGKPAVAPGARNYNSPMLPITKCFTNDAGLSQAWGMVGDCYWDFHARGGKWQFIVADSADSSVANR